MQNELCGSSARNVLVVGCGKWGTQHVRVAEELGILAAVADSAESAREAARQITSVPVYESIAHALVHPDVTAVIIATPPATHYEVARAAINAGNDVLVEKPLCTNIQDAEDLINQARRRSPPRFVMVGHILHYSSTHSKFVDLARSGFVGQIKRVRSTRFNFGTVRTNENVLWSFCPHDVSIILAIFDGTLPELVSCTAQDVLRENRAVEDFIDMSMLFHNGARAQIEASWLHPQKERRVVVYGTEGCLVLNEYTSATHVPRVQAFKWSFKKDESTGIIRGMKSDVEVQDIHMDNCTLQSNHATVDCLVGEIGMQHIHRNKTGELGEDLTGKSPLHTELQHFVNACASRDKLPLTDGDEGLRVLRVLKAASDSVASSATGGVWIKLQNTSENPQNESQQNEHYVDKTSVVDAGAKILPGTKVWHFSHVMELAEIGSGCTIGQNVFVGSKVILGNNVKVQNNVSIPEGVICEDDVFLGPSCVFTNILNPRAFISRRSQFLRTLVQHGASIGANATVLCGNTIGRYALVGAGSVVTKPVPNHGLVVGNPARKIGWVGRNGLRLQKQVDGLYICPETNERYFETGECHGAESTLRCPCCSVSSRKATSS